jgi:hypothetical protein
VNDASGPAGEADLERLAARLAMLASDDGEADNAGRAVGAMARRIGLTGGDLKRIFLAGAASVPGGAEHGRLEGEVSTLRQNLAMLDADAQRAAWERDVLRAENERLHASLAGLRASVRSWGLAGVAIALVLLVVGATAWIGQSHPAAAPRVAQDAAGLRRAAIVRPGGALLFRAPDRAGEPLVSLPGGQLVQVRRLVWKDLFQWAEVEAPGGLIGYVLTTEIDLS